MADKKSGKRSANPPAPAKPPLHIPASPRKPVMAFVILGAAAFAAWLAFLIYVACFGNGPA
ncbi:MAG TPA: hypothetical protein DCY79_13835 [Planctomycetaceae bacterium]|nr:hypothetical protein [Blastopirellula sp.]HAY80883.1 hypothetical protein [Planctomycetaceae bacterium]